MTSYEKGARDENEVKKQFEEQGHFVMRSAGSRGPFDLAIFEEETIRLIQVTRIGESVDEERLKNVRVPPNCKKEVWYKVPRRPYLVDKIE